MIRHLLYPSRILPPVSVILAAVALWAAPRPGVAAETRQASSHSIPIKTIEGRATTLNEWQGKVLLVVNTASRCGYTPQYEGLEKLHRRYADRGFAVLGFPSNDFGGQEPGSNSEIRYFCQTNYKVSFPLFEKGPVTGTAIQPLFKALVGDGPAIGWNFEKILLGADGKVLRRFGSTTAPDSAELTQAIQSAIEDRARLRPGK